MQNELLDALLTGDFGRADELVRAGVDVNELTDHGDRLLGRIIQDWETSTTETRRQGTRWLLDHGADLTLRDDTGCGPLFHAVFADDMEILKMVLDAGADPNPELDDPESLYDMAEFDYRYHLYELDLPEEPTPADQQSEEAWLDFLDRLAVKYGHPRPEIPLLLRQRGALKSNEQQRFENQNRGPA